MATASLSIMSIMVCSFVICSTSWTFLLSFNSFRSPFIFRTLASVGFAGWISVEDGMNGLDELRRSVAFLKRKREQYYTDR